MRIEFSTDFTCTPGLVPLEGLNQELPAYLEKLNVEATSVVKVYSIVTNDNVNGIEVVQKEFAKEDEQIKDCLKENSYYKPPSAFHDPPPCVDMLKFHGDGNSKSFNTVISMVCQDNNPDAVHGARREFEVTFLAKKDADDGRKYTIQRMDVRPNYAIHGLGLENRLWGLAFGLNDWQNSTKLARKVGIKKKFPVMKLAELDVAETMHKQLLGKVKEELRKLPLLPDLPVVDLWLSPNLDGVKSGVASGLTSPWRDAACFSSGFAAEKWEYDGCGLFAESDRYSLFA